jgi:putative transposase
MAVRAPTCAVAGNTAPPGRTRAPTAPNQKWAADLTRILTAEGVLWLASVRDAFSNKVVGWDSGPRATTKLVLIAVDYAIFCRDVRDGELTFHADKGCQYTSLRFTQRLLDAGIAPSTGGVGNCSTTPWPKTCNRPSKSG